MISPETLRRYALFAGLEPGVFKTLAMMGDEVSLAAGTWIFQEGSEADALYLVDSGSVELKLKLDEAGEHQIDLATLVAGDVLGWSALVEPYVYTLGAVASGDARLIRLDGAQLRGFMIDDCISGTVLMQRLAQALGKRLTNLRVQFASLVVD